MVHLLHWLLLLFKQLVVCQLTVISRFATASVHA